jgi:hypothetical protein
MMHSHEGIGHQAGQGHRAGSSGRVIGQGRDIGQGRVIGQGHRVLSTCIEYKQSLYNYKSKHGARLFSAFSKEAHVYVLVACRLLSGQPTRRSK